MAANQLIKLHNRREVGFITSKPCQMGPNTLATNSRETATKRFLPEAGQIGRCRLSFSRLMTPIGRNRERSRQCPERATMGTWPAIHSPAMAHSLACCLLIRALVSTSLGIRQDEAVCPRQFAPKGATIQCGATRDQPFIPVALRGCGNINQRWHKVGDQSCWFLLESAS